MNAEFARTLSLLRQEKKVSQRQAATTLGISQALLSHYENGVREPGLPFVVRACDYYNVSADFLLGRTLSRDGTVIAADELFDISQQRDNSMRGSVLAMLSKKLVVNSVALLFDLLGKTGSRTAITAAANYLGSAVAQLFRRLHAQTPGTNADFFAVPQRQFEAGALDIDMMLNQVAYVDALAELQKSDVDKFPDLSHEGLNATYPGLYQSLLQLLHQSGERTTTALSIPEENK